MNKVNAKEYPGSLKAGIESIPVPVLREVGMAMREGAKKYGFYNWRDGGCSASTYYNATWRHISDWWEGQDIDPDSPDNIHHLSKAIASLLVMRDALIHGTLEDDRPSKAKDKEPIREVPTHQQIAGS